MSLTGAPASKLLSLVFLLDAPSRRVLLGLKKRGFGEGKFNGFGGKLEEGETMPECARRELSEECGYDVPLHKLQSRGRMVFNMLSDGMVDRTTGAVASLLVVHIFTAAFEDASGDVRASDEMEPQWFDYDALPLERMWLDDKYWLPLLLDGNDVVGEFTFADEKTIVAHNVMALPVGSYAADPAKHEHAVAFGEEGEKESAH